jgi:Flp pilus assembly pilin Flp
MTMLMQYVKSFVNQEEGQDLLEYALLVALIALVAIVAVGWPATRVGHLRRHRRGARRRGVKSVRGRPARSPPAPRFRLSTGDRSRGAPACRHEPLPC